ncbi:protease-like activity factor CPAF, partial [Criblamydia sequanensis]|uniref:Chlamydial protease-like activity factor (CPAF) n=1 Tax=Candidatus Criblamydia sequanensis CRIB-18 TaxID=1437425 RepID=A0A090D0X2_9BACT
MNLKNVTSFLMAILLPFQVFSMKANEAMMHEALDIIKHTFKVQYAPSDWKKQHAGWDLNREIEKARDKIKKQSKNKTLPLKDFHKILRDFFNSTKDYHVAITFYSTEMACLPFKVKGAEGRYFITWVDKDRINDHSLAIGDELLEFNGKPVHEVVTKLKNEEMLSSNEETDYGLAEVNLTSRIGALGFSVPKGPVKLKIKHKNKKASVLNLEWDYFDEKISPRKAPISQENTHKDYIRELIAKPFELASWPILKEANSDFEEGPHDVGSKISYIPALGKKIWEAKQSAIFHAYLFEHNNKKIGFLRIPSYHGEAEEIEEFETLISFMQKNSDALIIDQVNNPGGSAFYLYALASMLTDKPLYPPKHKMSITQREVMLSLIVLPILEQIQSDLEAKEVIGDTLEGIPVDFETAQCFINYYNYIIDEWNAGRSITKPFSLAGFDYINPHPKCRYTKDILILTNSLDFSCADFFPAIMQDAKRAKIFGSRTAGAGGYIATADFPNILGIANYRYTGSIAERANLKPIENLGVTPDIPYKLTAEDLLTDCEPLKKALLKAVDDLFIK